MVRSAFQKCNGSQKHKWSEQESGMEDGKLNAKNMFTPVF
jgi:hypothetical protein